MMFSERKLTFILFTVYEIHCTHGRPQGGARGSGRSPLENLKKKKKKFEKKNVQTKFFNLQKAPIVCYAKNFPHKWPPCYVLNTQKGPHVMR